MTQWYYVDRNQQQIGPVAQDQLVQQFRLGNLAMDTLIWRDGMGQWQPLRDFAMEFGLSQAAPSQAFPSRTTERIEPVLTAPDIPSAEDPPTRTMGRVEPVLSPFEDQAETVEERPTTGRAVFTAREPSYAQYAAPHGSHAGTDAAAAHANATATAPESPYRPPSAPLSYGTQAVMTGHVIQAGFWKRFAASSIDGLLMMVAFFIVWIIGSLAFGFSMNSLANDMVTGAVTPLLILALYLIPIVLQAAYFTWMHASDYQATLGKMAVGIKVVRSDGEGIMTGRSLGRWAAYFFMHLFSCGITSLVSAFTVGLGQRKQGLHDMVCDTQVVDRWAFTRYPERQREELGAVTITVIALTALLAVGYVLVLLVAIPAMTSR